MTDPKDPSSPSSPTVPSASAPRGDRIAKLLARAGIASRREVERMIEDGRVALDGVVLATPATILTSLSGVTVDGEPVDAPAPTRLFLYHKPTGLLVTERDPAGRRTIYDQLPEGLPRLVPVGRLDLNTEGLLLLTTDGGLKRQLELPATGVERAYRARAYGMVSQPQLEDLIEGVEIEGVRYGSIDANIERRTGANVWIEMILTEGKNREVRRVLEHLELQVSRLIRTRYGPFVLGDLKPGEIGEVKQHDLVAFRKSLDGPKRPREAGPQPVVEVEARKAARPAPTKPAPAIEPDRPMRKATPTAQARPARPPSHTPVAPAKSGWGQGQKRRIQARNAPRDGDARSSREGEALFTRPPRAPRPSRSTAERAPSDKPPRRDGSAAPSRSGPSRPGKGPAGGRGHPPRTPGGKPRNPPRNGGKR